MVQNAESARLDEDARREKNWKRWGPYLSERQWATVREDTSQSVGKPNGSAKTKQTLADKFTRRPSVTILGSGNGFQARRGWNDAPISTFALEAEQQTPARSPSCSLPLVSI